MKKYFEVLDCANEIFAGLKKGALLTTKSGDKVNAMTISWGTLGIEWGKPIFTTFVRVNRFTRGMLDENPEFTICIPSAASDRKIGAICGTKSARDMDKIKELNLTLVDADEISVPAIAEYPIILECKLLYRQEQVLANLPDDIRAACYPEDKDYTESGSNRDAHIAYYGEVVKAYVIEE